MALNGFSTCRPELMASYRVPGTGISLRVRREIAPILIGFAAEFDRLVEKLDGPVMDCWGYACRRVRFRNAVSTHSAGISIDLNATRHPLGRRGTFTRRQLATIRNLCRKYGLVHGENWSRPDGMHFEIRLSRSEALQLVNKLQGQPQTAKGDRVPRLSALRFRADNDDVRLLQLKLREKGYVLTPDGIYGAKTKAAVSHFQRSQGWSGLDADGHMGPLTLARLFA